MRYRQPGQILAGLGLGLGPGAMSRMPDFRECPHDEPVPFWDGSLLPGLGPSQDAFSMASFLISAYPTLLKL
jgi:hypothetical protein